MRHRQHFGFMSRPFLSVFPQIAILASSLLLLPAAHGQTAERQELMDDVSVEEAQKASFEGTLEKADSGDVQEQFVVSHLYRDGAGVESDDEKADDWLKKSAGGGHTQAQSELGISLYGRGEYEEAFTWLLKAAQAGNADAQVRTAELYALGKGVKADFYEAMQWALKSAAQQDTNAMTDIGNLYERGLGVAQDHDAAMKWFRLAADAGNPVAMSNIGLLYMNGQGVLQDFHEAERWFTRSADRNSATGQLSLAYLYMTGPPEFRNPDKALPLLERAAGQGLEEAAKLLAYACLSGEIPALKKDPGRAKSLVAPLAEKGDVTAQQFMGAAEETEKNYRAAEAWYLKAAAQDDGPAVLALAELYSRGQGVPRDFAQAAKLYVRANDLMEDAAAANNAGWFFATCEDHAFRDPELAIKYALRGVELSNGTKAGHLDTLAEAYFVSQQYDQAVATEERALELEPQSEGFKKSLARFRTAQTEQHENR